jgi:DNA-directed RNA polymerase specialized sigma24 family protein
MYYYLHQLLRTRAIDEYRKARRKKTQSLEGMLKDRNGKESDHNAVLSAGKQYQPEQTLI